MSAKRVLFISGRQGGKALAQAEAVAALRAAGVEVVEASPQSFAVSGLAEECEERAMSAPKKSHAEKLTDLEKQAQACRAFAEEMERNGRLAAARKQRRDLARLEARCAAYRRKHKLGGER